MSSIGKEEVHMSRLTVFLARFIGLFTVVLVVALLMRGSAMVETMVADEPVMLVYAIISLAAGLAIVPSREWLKFGWRSLRVAQPK